VLRCNLRSVIVAGVVRIANACVTRYREIAGGNEQYLCIMEENDQAGGKRISCRSRKMVNELLPNSQSLPLCVSAEQLSVGPPTGCKYLSKLGR
jgi:hypothetical protein